MSINLRQRFHPIGFVFFNFVCLLMSCITTTSVEKPNSATNEQGTGTTDRIEGAILAPIAVYRQLISLNVQVEIRPAKNCPKPRPLKNLSIVLLKSEHANESLVHQYSVEKSSFVLPLKLTEGRYFAELRDERLGRTLERKVVEVGSSSGPWLFIDPC